MDRPETKELLLTVDEQIVQTQGAIVEANRRDNTLLPALNERLQKLRRLQKLAETAEQVLHQRAVA